MVKKKISGQTIAIIVLIVLLIAAIAFGGVYAFYSTSTKPVSGTIVMATLSIDFDESTLGTGSSGQSEILITKTSNIVPNELLGNSPLKIVNNSTTPIYVVVLYRVERAIYDAEKGNLDSIYHYIEKGDNDKYDKGIDEIVYQNGVKKSFGVLDIGTSDPTSNWADFIFDTSNYPEYAQDSIDWNDDYVVRCFVTKAPETETSITVIEKDALKLHADMGNEFQGKDISFTFQAHAIASNSIDALFNGTETQQQKSETIVRKIYETTGFKFTI